jgi:CMP-N-acetylneuraminic acid synthetase
MNKYTAEIPVRIGSKRISKKNLRLINGKPMVAYVIDSCKKSKYLGEIYINSDSEVLKKVADEYEVNFYKRPSRLGLDMITQDQFNYDFLKTVETEYLVMVNPVTPLILPEDIDNSIEYFEKNNLDTLIPVYDVRLHSFFSDKPLNFNIHEHLPVTQVLEPVRTISWAVCIWNKKKFIEHYERHGFAIFVGKYALYPFNHFRSLKISQEEDFQLASLYLSARENKRDKIEYYE